MKNYLWIAFLMFSGLIQAAQTDAQRELSIVLSDAVRSFNQGGPSLLDDETRLDSAATFSNIIIYNFTLLKYSADQLNIAAVDEFIEQHVLANLCGNKELETFITYKVIMAYRYYGNDGKFVTEGSKDMATCAQ